MIYYPILLNLADVRCVIVGGGEVARRKIHHLLEAGARLLVCAPRVHPRIAQWALDGALDLRRQSYRREILDPPPRLVFACTDEPKVNRKVVADARAIGVPCNAAEDQASGDFHVPSMVRRGSLLLTVSTGGLAPALSREICHRLEQQFGPAWGDFAQLLGRLREEWKSRGEAELIHQRMLEIIASDVFEVLQARGRQAALARIDALIESRPPRRAAKRLTRSRRSA